MGPSRERTYGEIADYLARLGRDDLVLVGGQAIGFWVERYIDRVPELEAGAPYASKDIDLRGSREDVEACAEALGGTPNFVSEPEPRTLGDARFGFVEFEDAQGDKLTLDILRNLYGFEDADDDVRKTAIPFDVGDGTILVMHPERCMESRAHNCAGLPEYRTDRGINQLRASIHCCREFLKELLHDGKRRAVFNLNERIFRFATEDRHGTRVHQLTGCEPFEAVLCDSALGTDFVTKRYPQMVERVARARARTRQEDASR